MQTKIGLGIAAALGVVCVLGQVVASPKGGGGDRSASAPPSNGPDVTVSRIGLDSSGNGNDFWVYGSSGGISAYSAATTSCNVGNQTAQWFDGQAAHPVIAQNVYRWSNGRFEQIGLNWLKHSFCAVSEPTCGSCQATGCSTLGIGCADTYWATLNGGQSGMGPRSQINPQGMGAGQVIMVYPPSAPSGGSATLRGRVQIAHSDITNGNGERYVIEAHYVTHDEPRENRTNNASWREITLTDSSMAAVGVGQASVKFQQPGIRAWKEFDPSVTIVNVDVPNEGRFHVGYKVTDNLDGTWTYEYAVHNLNSHQSAEKFIVPIGEGVTLSSVGFHDISYHSGEPFSSTDWTNQQVDGTIEWATQPHSVNSFANAIRWGSMYNFRFTADSAPVATNATIDLFLAGPASSVDLPVMGPAPMVVECAANIAGDDDVVNVFDLLDLLANWGTEGPGAAIAEPTNTVDVFDLLGLLSAWGDC